MGEYETGSQFPMSADSLHEADRATQLEVMELWFRERYEDPAEHTPHDSQEGGYVWIWGGPYDAQEELENEFGGVVRERAIEELAEKLDGECTMWAATPGSDRYDSGLVADIARITEYYDNFSGAILDLEKLLQTEVDDSVSGVFLRMLFVNAITALETYLSDAFISTVLRNPTLLRNFVETTPGFRAMKVSVAAVFAEMDGMPHRARTYLGNMGWHHLSRVKPMYEQTLAVKFPETMDALFRAIRIRHDIVHRNGKTKEGEEIVIATADVTALVSEIEKLVQIVDEQLPRR